MARKKGDPVTTQITGLSVCGRYFFGIFANNLPKVYTLVMNKHAIINLKTDPDLKESASKTAKKLGVSLSAVLNNELRRFATEQNVIFEIPEIPNKKTAKELAEIRKQVEAGDYYKFDTNEQALEFLDKELA